MRAVNLITLLTILMKYDYHLAVGAEDEYGVPVPLQVFPSKEDIEVILKRITSEDTIILKELGFDFENWVIYI